MHTFKDNAGRLWTVSINVNAIKKCRALVNVDLYGLVDEGFQGLAKLLGDPVTLIDVLYVLCQDQAEKSGVSDEDFGRAMAGDAIGHASDAFVEELTDFFPDPRVRAALGKVVEAGRMVQAGMLDHATEQLDRLDVAAVVNALKASSGGSPGSSESTPDRSPSANST